MRIIAVLSVAHWKPTDCLRAGTEGIWSIKGSRGAQVPTNSHADIGLRSFRKRIKKEGEGLKDSYLFSGAGESTGVTAVGGRAGIQQGDGFCSGLTPVGQCCGFCCCCCFFSCPMDYILFPNTKLRRVTKAERGNWGVAEEAVALW